MTAPVSEEREGEEREEGKEGWAGERERRTDGGREGKKERWREGERVRRAGEREVGRERGPTILIDDADFLSLPVPLHVSHYTAVSIVDHLFIPHTLVANNTKQYTQKYMYMCIAH